LWTMTETLSVVTFPSLILRLADFPAWPLLKFGSTILERTPSVGRQRPNLLPKKRCECGSNKRVCELNVMFLLAAKCETAGSVLISVRLNDKPEDTENKAANCDAQKYRTGYAHNDERAQPIRRESNHCLALLAIATLTAGIKSTRSSLRVALYFFCFCRNRSPDSSIWRINRGDSQYNRILRVPPFPKLPAVGLICLRMPVQTENFYHTFPHDLVEIVLSDGN
jgi:hypothetical protein